MQPTITAGIDVGGHSLRVRFYDGQEFIAPQEFIEYASDFKQGPDACLRKVLQALEKEMSLRGVLRSDLRYVGLATPGPASLDGVISERGSSNAGHPDWANFPVRLRLEELSGVPTIYGNDGNFAALWAHQTAYGAMDTKHSSYSLVVGTGVGAGLILNGKIWSGMHGLGGEGGHIHIPVDEVRDLIGSDFNSRCNCGRKHCLEGAASLTSIGTAYLPLLLRFYPDHPLRQMPLNTAALRVRTLAVEGDEMCRKILRCQALLLGIAFAQMEMLFDFHVEGLFLGGGLMEVPNSYQAELLEIINNRLREDLWPEKKELTVRPIPFGDQAGARGAAIAAFRAADEQNRE